MMRRRGTHLSSNHDLATKTISNDNDEKSYASLQELNGTMTRKQLLPGLPSKARVWGASTGRFLWLFSSLLSIGFIVTGRILAHGLLHIQEECDMTWSYRQFVEIQLPSATGVDRGNDNNDKTPYKLFKFTDGRDPRHEGLFERSQVLGPIQDNSFCKTTARNNHKSNKTTTTTTTVLPILYIPGHGGNYQQARSLGAHALGLSAHALDEITIQQVVSQYPKVDVYAVDFQEEWTALSAFYFERQTTFVQAAIRHLMETCQFSSALVLVGHSMGGLVARAAAAGSLRQQNKKQKYVTAIITLATPHVRPILTWDASVIQWHQQLSKQQYLLHDIPIISIAGGVRDEMIPVETTDADPTSASSLTLMATDIMELAHDDSSKVPPKLGMGHEVIVWCHNLMVPVRRILLHLFRTQDQSSTLRLQYIETMFPKPFKDAIQRQHVSLQSIYGQWQAAAMEASFLCHVEWLMWFYTFLGAWHLVMPFHNNNKSNKQSPAVTPVLVIMALTAVTAGDHQPYFRHWLHPPHLGTISTLVLVMTANTMFWTVRAAVSWCAPQSLAGRKEAVTRRWLPFAVAIGMVLLLLTAATVPGMAPAAMLLYLNVLAIARVVTMGETEVTLVTWLLPLLTISLGGNALVMARATATSSAHFGIGSVGEITVAKLCIPVALRLFMTDDRNKRESNSFGLFQMVRILGVLLFGAGMVSSATLFHPIGALIVTIAGCDLLEMAWVRNRDKHTPKA